MSQQPMYRLHAFIGRSGSLRAQTNAYIAGGTKPIGWDIFDRSLCLGYEAAQHLMALRNGPDAIVAATDMLAIGALKFLNKAGVDVPGQVSVVGYDNIHLSSMLAPALSTIAQPVEQIANEAMSILLHKIEVDNAYNKSFLAKSTFLKRASSR